MRLRPSHEPHLQTLIHTLNGYQGGTYGFYSGHASNAFAVAFFMITSLSGKRKYILPAAMVYAILTAYSRIYLGVHYPGDILMGAIVGALLGTGLAFAHEKLRTKFILKD
jgi:undecaprenyl-diphosphatase